MAISLLSGVTALANATLTDPRTLLMNAGYSFETEPPNATPPEITFNCNQSGTTVTLTTGTIPSGSNDGTVYQLQLVSGALPAGLTNLSFYFVTYVSASTFNLRAAGSGNNITGTTITLTAATGTAKLKAIGLAWNTGRSITYTAAAPYGRNSYCVGFNFSSPTDLSQEFFSTPIGITEIASSSNVGAMLLIDANGNWARYKLTTGSTTLPLTTSIFNLQSYTACPNYMSRSSASFDITTIVKVLAIVSTSTSGQRQAVAVGSGNINRLGNAILVGSGTLEDAMATLIAASPINVDLGNTVYRIAQPFQLGNDGVNATSINQENGTIVYNQITDGTLRVPMSIFANDIKLKLRGGASDNITLKNHQIKGVDTWTYNTQSAVAPGTKDLSGTLIINAAVTLGPYVHNNTTFVNCPSFTQNGATLNNCVFTNTSISSNDPDGFVNCRFTSGGTGHALTITAAGTHNFFGNTFVGYGADGTTNAAIYNNSGGAVTLVLIGGNQVPTVRNGAGASTSFVVSCTFSGMPTGSIGQVLSLEELDGSGNSLGSPVFLRPSINTGTGVAVVSLKPNTKYAYIADALGYYPSQRMILDTAITSLATLIMNQIVDALGNPRYGNGLAGEMALIAYDAGDDDIHIAYSGAFPTISYNSFLDATELIYTTHDFIESRVLKPTYGDGEVVWTAAATTKIADQTGNTGTPALGFFPHKAGESTAYGMLRVPFYTVYGLHYPSTAFVVQGGFTRQGVADAMHDAPSIGITTEAGSVADKLDDIKAKTDPLTFTVANQLDANIQYVNDVQVKGAGTELDPWNPA